MSITLKLIFDGRRPLKKKGDAFPYKLRVTRNRQPLEFQTIYSLTKKEEEKLSAPHISASLQKVREHTKKCLTDAQTYVNNVGSQFTWYAFIRDFINQHPGFVKRKQESRPAKEETQDFDFGPYEKRFKSIFREEHPSKEHISYAFSIYVKKLIRRKKIGSALNYQYAYNSLKKFRGNVQFEKITEDWLFEYEDWKVNTKGRSLTTVAINLRSLRCIFNLAASKQLKIINKENCYPFGKHGYQIPAPRNTKVALSAKDLLSVYNYKTDDPEKALAMDYWWFLYFGNGMNLKDAALLKYKNMNEEFIKFNRAKTDRAGGRSTLPIIVTLDDDIKSIIARIGNVRIDDDTYILPILQPQMNPLQIHDVVKAHIRFVNRNVKEVFAELGLQEKSTTKVTRHSFLTQQKQNGSTIEEIKDLAGHAVASTTEWYMGSFEESAQKEFSRRKSAFKETANVSTS